MHPFLPVAPPVVIAHRGGVGDAPQTAEGESIAENSDIGFARSVGLGVRYLESDIRTTADGVAVLNHDPDLRRVAGWDVQVADLPWSEISRITLPGGGRIMRLSDALVTWPGIRWVLDVKDERSIAPAATTLIQAKALDRVCVSSFSRSRVRRLRDILGPDAATGGTWSEVLSVLRVPSSSRYSARMWQPGPLRPVALQVPPGRSGVRLISKASVAAAHAVGLQVHAWTINSPAEMTRLLEMGVDGLITDNPLAAQDVIRTTFHSPITPD